MWEVCFKCLMTLTSIIFKNGNIYVTDICDRYISHRVSLVGQGNKAVLLGDLQILILISFFRLIISSEKTQG